MERSGRGGGLELNSTPRPKLNLLLALAYLLARFFFFFCTHLSQGGLLITPDQPQNGLAKLYHSSRINKAKASRKASLPFGGVSLSIRYNKPPG